jgi:ADP-ribosylglycohydrolase
MTAGPAVERFQGALLGQALADAIGRLVEGHTPETCQAFVADLRSHTGPIGFGQYTDDTQLARELASSLVDCGGLDPADYGRRVAALFMEERVVGRGRATAMAAERLARGVPWTQSGTPAPQAGNGSAMRAAPIGLFYYADPEALRAAAVDQGRITHQDSRCAAGSVAVAAAVAGALQRGELEPRAFTDAIAHVVGDLDPLLPGFLHELPRLIALPASEALPVIAPMGKSPGGDEWPGISPFVVGTVVWSLYAFLRHPDDYREAVFTAIEGGGDADTTAAITGAIAGARVGLAGLPAWVEAVEDRGTWRAADLKQLAARLHAAARRRAEKDRR